MIATDELAAVPLFAGRPTQQLRTIRRTGTLLDLSPGHVICRRGDRPAQFAVVLDGEVSVRHDGGHFIAGPGSHFGALETSTGRRHPATVVCERDVRVLVFDPRSFARLLDLVPSVARLLMTEVAKRAYADPYFGAHDVRSFV